MTTMRTAAKISSTVVITGLLMGCGGERIRKNVKALTAEERADYVAAVKALKTVPSPYDSSLNYYDQFVAWHLDASRCTEGAHHQTSIAHMAPAFLPWHRVFVLLFEEALRKVSGKNMTVPYWDIADPDSTLATFADDFMGGDGDPGDGYAVHSGPFRSGEFELKVMSPGSGYRFSTKPYLVRIFAAPLSASSTKLPSAADVEAALNLPEYDVPPYDVTADNARSFRNTLEGWIGFSGMVCTEGIMKAVRGPNFRYGIHAQGHVYVGGTSPIVGGGPQDLLIGTLVQPTSPNDPTFFLHHSNMDRLWASWQERHGQSYAPLAGGPQGNNIDDLLIPFHELDTPNSPRKVQSIKELGYRYEQ